MRSLFNPDSKLFRALSDAVDLILLDLLTLLCSVPLITAGAAFCALYAAADEIRLGNGDIFRCYFRSFRRCFYPASVAYLIMAGSCCSAFVMFRFAGLESMLFVFVALTVFSSFFSCWFFPLTAITAGPVMTNVRRAFMCSLAYLPRTMLMTALNLAPGIMCLLMPEVFLDSFSWILLFWFAFAAYADLQIIRKPLQNITGHE